MELSLKTYQIASLFDMYIDMCETVAGKQGGQSLSIDRNVSLPRPKWKIVIFWVWTYILYHVAALLYMYMIFVRG